MLSDCERHFLAHQRVAYFATADSRAVPHVVPVCFAIVEHTLYITIDEKPKRLSSLGLKRLRNIAENPAVAVWSTATMRIGHGSDGLCCGVAAKS